MASKTYTVAIKAMGETMPLYASEQSGAWSYSPVSVSEARKDEAVAEAVEQSLPYDVIERTRHPLGHKPAFEDVRIGGTAQIVKVR